MDLVCEVTLGEIGMREGIIRVDSREGKKLGFVSSRFTKSSYLWKQGNYIYISVIQAVTEDVGYFSDLCKTIIYYGCGIKIPTPFNRMREIALKQGYEKTVEYSEETSSWYDTWVKKPEGEARERLLKRI
jgi:hypothetical protein